MSNKRKTIDAAGLIEQMTPDEFATSFKNMGIRQYKESLLKRLEEEFNIQKNADTLSTHGLLTAIMIVNGEL